MVDHIAIIYPSKRLAAERGQKHHMPLLYVNHGQTARIPMKRYGSTIRNLQTRCCARVSMVLCAVFVCACKAFTHPASLYLLPPVLSLHSVSTAGAVVCEYGSSEDQSLNPCNYNL